MTNILEKIHSNNAKSPVGENTLTEDELDQAVEDSFPASDPPSHTPTTSIGGPARDTDEIVASHPMRSRLIAGAAAAGLLVMLGVVVAVGRKLRS